MRKPTVAHKTSFMIVSPTPENIEKAAALIAAGELVSFPTETVYGLGADATSSAAVAKIFALKGRPAFNPLIVHIAAAQQLEQVSDLALDERAAARAKKLLLLWPGSLSLVLPKRANIVAEVTAGLATVAVRIPRHPIALQLLTRCKTPLAAPSANRFTTISPTTAQHVIDSFGDAAPLTLDGGACEVGLESTIVSLLGEEVQILRPGAVTIETLQAALGPEEQVSFAKAASGPVCAPGMLKVHYAPKTPLALYGELNPAKLPKRTGLITFKDTGPEPAFDFIHVSCLSSSGDLNQIAARLFAALREFDTLGLDLIVVDTCPETGIGVAIMDRLRRAAAASQK